MTSRDFGFDGARLFGRAAEHLSITGVDVLFYNVTALRIHLDFAGDNLTRLAPSTPNGTRPVLRFLGDEVLDELGKLMWAQGVDMYVVVTDQQHCNVARDAQAIDARGRVKVQKAACVLQHMRRPVLVESLAAA